MTPLLSQWTQHDVLSVKHGPFGVELATDGVASIRCEWKKHHRKGRNTNADECRSSQTNGWHRDDEAHSLYTVVECVWAGVIGGMRLTWSPQFTPPSLWDYIKCNNSSQVSGLLLPKPSGKITTFGPDVRLMICEIQPTKDRSAEYRCPFARDWLLRCDEVGFFFFGQLRHFTNQPEKPLRPRRGGRRLHPPRRRDRWAEVNLRRLIRRRCLVLPPAHIWVRFSYRMLDITVFLRITEPTPLISHPAWTERRGREWTGDDAGVRHDKTLIVMR